MISSSFPALTVQFSIILDWMEPWTMLSVLSLRKQGSIPLEGCSPAWREIRSWQTEMGRLKQTLGLKEERGRQQKGMGKDKGWDLVSKPKWDDMMSSWGTSKGNGRESHNSWGADLSGNKEQHYWWASEQVIRKAWPRCAFGKNMTLRAQSKALEPTFHGILPWVLPLDAINCRALCTDSALFDQQRRAGAQHSLLSCGACVGTPAPRGAF